MIGEAAGKVLDVTEAGVARAAAKCMWLGSWAVPLCYRRECEKLVETRRNPPEVLRKDKRLLRDIGDLALEVRRLGLPVIPEIQTIAEAVGSTLHDPDYSREFDPYQAKLLERIAPLTSEDTE